jgi:hypothetical protein
MHLLAVARLCAKGSASTSTSASQWDAVILTMPMVSASHPWGKITAGDEWLYSIHLAYDRLTLNILR